MKDELYKILEEAKRELAKATDQKVLEELRIKYLGKKGQFKDILSKLGGMSDEMRRESKNQERGAQNPSSY